MIDMFDYQLFIIKKSTTAIWFWDCSARENENPKGKASNANPSKSSKLLEGFCRLT
jgi:hypothetical protein